MIKQRVKTRFETRNTVPRECLFFYPVVAIFSRVTALTYALSYLMITTLTEIMENKYGFSTGIVGLSFLGLGNLQDLLYHMLFY